MHTVAKRIWEFEKGQVQKTLNSSEKIMLLAMADHANKDSICWPGYETLADMCAIKKRQAIKTVEKLINKGFVLKIENVGRGNSNIYLLRIGLTDEEVSDIIARRFTENGVLVHEDKSIRKVASDTGKGVLQDTINNEEKVHSSTEKVHSSTAKGVLQDTRNNIKQEETITTTTKAADLKIINNEQETQAALKALTTNYEDFISISIPPILADEFKEYAPQVKPAWIANAYKAAIRANARNWNYPRAILDNCIEAGGWVEKKKNGAHKNASHQNHSKKPTRKTGADLATKPTFDPYTGKTIPAK